MKFLFLIPARGGSKGIPKKNIKRLNGKPLIQYTIEAVPQNYPKKDICISTDSSEIADVVESLGLKVPFLRPKELALDHSGSFEVIIHALDFYTNLGIEYDAIVLLQPTSPMRTKDHVEKAIDEFIKNKDIDMLVAVKESDANPYYNLFEENDLGYLSKSKEGNYIRRQDCPSVYEYNGAIYIINVNALKQNKSLQFNKTVKFVMDRESSIDIDTLEDWNYCEYLMLQNEK